RRCPTRRPAPRPLSRRPVRRSRAAPRCWCSDRITEATPMIIRKKPPRTLKLHEPIRHESAHKRPVTRRDFLAQGFLSGAATVMVPSALAMLLNPRTAFALDADIQAQKVAC